MQEASPELGLRLSDFTSCAETPPHSWRFHLIYGDFISVIVPGVSSRHDMNARYAKLRLNVMRPVKVLLGGGYADSDSNCVSWY